MTATWVIIDDRVRSREERVSVDADVPVTDLVMDLVSRWGLPKRDFVFDPIDYWLLRLPDEQDLPRHVTLRELGISEGASLALESRDGRRVWEAINRLLDEIEKELKGRIKSEIRKRIEEKLEEILKTEARPEELAAIQGQLARMGPPEQPPSEPTDAPRRPSRPSRAPPRLVTRALWILVLAVVVVVVIIVVRPDDGSPETRILGVEVQDVVQAEDHCVFRVLLVGEAFDSEDGEIGDSNMSWSTDRGEPLGSGREVPAELPVPLGESTTYEIILEATDRDGNVGSDSRRVEPLDC